MKLSLLKSASNWAETHAASRHVLVVGGFLMAMLGIALSKFRPPNFALTSLYLRYQELGFVKRGLLGTLLSPVLPERISPGLGLAIIVTMGVIAIAAVCLLLGLLYKKNEKPLLSITCVLSPAMFIQMGYLFGFLDIYCFLCLLLTALIVTRLNPSLWSLMLVFVLGIAGPFFHELYLLAFFPLAFLISIRRSRRYSGAVLLSAILAAAIIALFGSFESGAKSLELAISGHYSLPIEASIFELTSSLSRNAFGTTAYLFRNGEFIRSFAGVAYLIILLSSLSVSGAHVPLRLAYWLAALSPLLLNFLGGDSSRWIGMACMNLFLLGIMGLVTISMQTNAKKFAVFLFTLLGPIGVGASFPIVYWKLMQALS